MNLKCDVPAEDKLNLLRFSKIPLKRLDKLFGLMGKMGYKIVKEDS